MHRNGQSRKAHPSVNPAPNLPNKLHTSQWKPSLGSVSGQFDGWEIFAPFFASPGVQRL